MEWFHIVVLRSLKKIFPNGRLITLEDGTHDITYRQPTQVGKAIIDFIDSH